MFKPYLKKNLGKMNSRRQRMQAARAKSGYMDDIYATVDILLTRTSKQRSWSSLPAIFDATQLAQKQFISSPSIARTDSYRPKRTHNHPHHGRGLDQLLMIDDW